MQVYKSTVDFYILIFYPTTLLNSFSSSKWLFLVGDSRFSTWRIISSANYGYYWKTLLADSKTYKILVIKIAWYWYKEKACRPMEYSPGTDPLIYSQCSQRHKSNSVAKE